MKIKITILISIILISNKADSQTVFFNAPFSTVSNQIKYDKYKSSVNVQRNVELGYINKINYQYDVVVSLRWLTTSNNIYNNILNSNTYNQYSFLAFQLGIRKLDGINKKIDFLREIGIGYGSSFNFTQLVETPFSETKQKNNGTSLIAYYKTGIKFNVLKKMSLALLIQGQSDLSSRIIINNKKIKQNINQIGLAFYYNLKK